jgi:hypothetical protein
MFKGISYSSLYFELCEHFVYGKKNKVKFPTGATKAYGILWLIHTDVFGLVHVPLLCTCFLSK